VWVSIANGSVEITGLPPCPVWLPTEPVSTQCAYSQGCLGLVPMCEAVAAVMLRPEGCLDWSRPGTVCNAGLHACDAWPGAVAPPALWSLLSRWPRQQQ